MTYKGKNTLKQRYRQLTLEFHPDSVRNNDLPKVTINSLMANLTGTPSLSLSPSLSLLLSYTVLCCPMLSYTVLCCPMLSFAVLCCPTLWCTITILPFLPLSLYNHCPYYCPMLSYTMVYNHYTTVPTPIPVQSLSLLLSFAVLYCFMLSCSFVPLSYTVPQTILFCPSVLYTMLRYTVQYHSALNYSMLSCPAPIRSFFFDLFHASILTSSISLLD